MIIYIYIYIYDNDAKANQSSCDQEKPVRCEHLMVTILNISTDSYSCNSIYLKYH